LTRNGAPTTTKNKNDSQTKIGLPRENINGTAIKKHPIEQALSLFSNKNNFKSSWRGNLEI
jgi:hypothetical protein